MWNIERKKKTDGRKEIILGWKERKKVSKIERKSVTFFDRIKSDNHNHKTVTKRFNII